MEKIIEPIDRALLKAELTSDRFMRMTRKGENEIYCLNIHNAPNVLQEIGRLREVTFRASGGGTGLSVDLDEFDTNEICYDQLIVWSPEDERRLGCRPGRAGGRVATGCWRQVAWSWCFYQK